MIFGIDGATEFVASGGRLEAGEDGCYIILKQVGNEITIGSDFCGHDRLFYFFDGTNWAVSNSFICLAEHLVENGVALRVDINHLAAWFSKNANFKQLLCEKTAVTEIKFLPADQEIVIQRGSLSSVTRSLPLVATYDEALSSYLSLWRNRTATVLGIDRAFVSVDVSGGLDTRTSIGFLSGAKKAEAGHVSSEVKFRTSVGEGFEQDEIISRTVAASLGVALVEPEEVKEGQRLTAEQSIEQWRAASLGQYAPVRLPENTMNPALINIRGSGGEIMRGVYKEGDCQKYLDNQQKKYGTHLKGNRKEWRNDVESSISGLASRSSPYQSPLLGYFRQYRSRCHAGTAARQGFSVFPLVGKSVYQCTAAMGDSAVVSRQLHFDIMYNLHPEFLELPFDEEKKSPSARNLESLVSVSLTDVRAGNFFVARAELDRGRNEVLADNTVFDNLYAGFLSYLKDRIDGIPRNIVSDGYIRDAVATMQEKASGDRRVKPNETRSAHNLALLGELARLTDLSRHNGWNLRFNGSDLAGRVKKLSRRSRSFR